MLAQLALSGLLWAEEEGLDFIRRWFNLYPEVEEYIAFQHYLARRYRLVFDPFGRWRDIPEVKSVHSWIRDAGLRQAGNMKIQSYAAGQMKLGMGETDYRLLEIEQEDVWVWPLMTIHDQVITEAESDWADEVKLLQEDVFDNVMVDKDTGEDYSRVPIKSDTDVGTRWVKG